MQLAFTGLLVTIVCALGVQALNSDQDGACRTYAIHQCPNNKNPDNANAFAAFGYICMRPYWESLTTNDNCPHPKAGCRCYNGCVKDRWSDSSDVGGWCTVACKIAALWGQQIPHCK
ncbi:hypothetical protein V8E36_006912 [Tilletia maclaganii]